MKVQKILIVGSGAREHAICRKINESNLPKEIFCIASNMNPGLAELCSEIVVKNINDPGLIVEYAKQKDVSLVIVGPENPLYAGVADALWDAKIKVVGPKKNLAQIETSKAFTRELLSEYKIPGGPKYQTFNSMNGVSNFLNELGDAFVVKYDGLAGGKGVKVAGDHLHSHQEAILYCQEILDKNGEFVIEEQFFGEEFSLMSFCDGRSLKHMPAIQDHKRAYENDTGPNTGGMGTYSDADHSLPFLTKKDIEEACSINKQTVSALQNKFGEGYKGILYGGFMATENGVKLIEYNARFGDPEAMNVLSILESDLIEIFNAITGGTLEEINVRFQNKATVCKYGVPEGYPDTPVKGKKIEVSAVKDPDRLFYASVDLVDNELIQAGSRAVAFVGIADSITEAEAIAEREISSIKGPLFHRTDIGTDAVIQKRVEHMQKLR
ncbi:MAG: phosphoribosylamine--glycine ligase [Flavobacteriaceae bacterium]|nr:phosphoribosylamine--glycine ligase [Flavobacteriaceae bacterium]